MYGINIKIIQVKHFGTFQQFAPVWVPSQWSKDGAAFAGKFSRNSQSINKLLYLL